MQDAADYLCININTLRYRIQRNEDDCDNGIYDVKLSNLMQKIKILGVNSQKRFSRIYERYIILDLEEFAREFNNYLSYLKSRKLRKKQEKFGWTRSAVECYKAKTNCSKCTNAYICSSIAKSRDDGIPPMKKMITELLDKIGLPPKIY